jgi:hypothetical protein
MSHFTKIKITIKNGEILHKILQELGYTVETNTNIRGYAGANIKAEYVIRQNNGYDLGFNREGENYQLIADFWGAKINQTEFINKISQKYAHYTLMEQINQQGFNIEEQETLEDGTIRVVVGKWV